MSTSVLIVDDNPEIVAFLKTVLTEYGLDSFACDSIERAYAVMKGSRVDLALVGQALPDGSGVDFVSSLRQRGNKLEILFLADDWLTGALYDRLVGELRVRKVLHKPLSANELIVQLQMVLGSFADDDLPVVEAEPLATEEVEAQQSAARIRRARGKLETSIDERVREIIAVADDAEALAPLAREVEQMAMSVSNGALAAAARKLGQAASDGLLVRGDVDALVAAHLATDGPEMQTMLLIDDDHERAMALQDLASELDVRLIVRGDLEEAGAALEGVQAVFIHMAARAVDPFHAARVVRTLDGAMPVVFVGPETDLDTRVAAVHAGGSVLLSEPINAGDLDAALRRIQAERQTLKPQVLVVDDRGAFAGSLTPALSSYCEVAVLSEPGRLFDVLPGQRPDVLLVAADLVGLSGFDVCRLVRATPGWAHIPVLLVFDQAPQAARVATFEAGADDWVSRPLIPEELLARIRLRAERVRELREQSAIDPLSGVRNRGSFLQGFRQRVAEALREERPLSLCVVAVVQHSRLTHTHGHRGAERVVGALGRLLARRFRAGDLVGRWSEEAFAVSMMGVERELADGVVQRVATEFVAMSFDGTGGPFHVELSWRAAELGVDGDSVDSLLAALRQ